MIRIIAHKLRPSPSPSSSRLRHERGRCQEKRKEKQGRREERKGKRRGTSFPFFIDWIKEGSLLHAKYSRVFVRLPAISSEKGHF